MAHRSNSSFSEWTDLADTTKIQSGTSPSDVERMILEIVKEWALEGDIGIGFPGIVDGTTIIDAPNLGQGGRGLIWFLK